MKKLAKTALAAAIAGALLSTAVWADGVDVKEEKLKFGFAASSMDTNDMLWYEGVQKALAEYPNIELNIFDAEGTGEKQTQQFEEMLNQGYNAIIVNAIDTAALSSITREAEDEGVKVVHINIGPDTVHTGGVENVPYNVGVLAAQDALEKVDSAKCVAIGPPVSMSAVVIGVQGFKDTIAGNENFEFLEEQAGDWTTENANEIARNLLTKYNNDIDVIFCHNDAMAMGAAQAVEAAGLTGEVLIYGSDGLQEACAYIKEGKMTGTVYCDPVQEGYDAAMMALDALAEGTDTASLTETPVVEAEAHIVDLSNVDELLNAEETEA
ncbi:MAG: sugar ABC transporter substrate-binding protein [Lachnospiraceae bacterium]|nr:sugar ABC transporter substrate-binding protein [Lachnospiraceae bacterium]